MKNRNINGWIVVILAIIAIIINFSCSSKGEENEYEEESCTCIEVVTRRDYQPSGVWRFTELSRQTLPCQEPEPSELINEGLNEHGRAFEVYKEINCFDN